MEQSSNNGASNARGIMQSLQQSKPTEIAELEFVRNKFIQNYNACHKEKVGELMYHRQVIHFKQAIANSDALQKCDPFSLYACFVTAAVNGYSLDPQDNEIYLIPRGGKAYLERQAGAHVRRLMRTNQIQYADQARLVYQGDEFEVMNGRVIKHMERFQSENIVAGYVRFVIDSLGNDRFFIYRKSDWESWKKRSTQANGQNWSGNNGLPEPGFLRTKLVLHACKEKCWAIGIVPVAVDSYEDIEIDADDEVKDHAPASAPQQCNAAPVQPGIPVQQKDFAEPSMNGNHSTVTSDNDTF